MDTLSTFKVAEILSINRNTLQSWIDSGYVPIQLSEDKKRYRFGMSGLMELILFKELMDVGHSRVDAADIVIGVNFNTKILTIRRELSSTDIDLQAIKTRANQAIIKGNK